MKLAFNYTEEAGCRKNILYMQQYIYKFDRNFLVTYSSSISLPHCLVL